jgi:uncharacterized membrane protein YsdA (DUF1294 family)
LNGLRYSAERAWFIPPLVLVYAVAVGWAVWSHMLPTWFPLALLALNLVTFFAYRSDKYRAQQDQWRIAETQLDLWSFAGGWIGGWFAQQLLRHKTRKASFRAVYWFSVIAHCAALAAWLSVAQNGLRGLFN